MGCACKPAIWCCCRPWTAAAALSGVLCVRRAACGRDEGGRHLGGPVDAVGLLAGLATKVLHAAGAGAHVLHGVHGERRLGALPVQHRKAAAPGLPPEVHHLVVPVGQLQHLQRPQVCQQVTSLSVWGSHASGSLTQRDTQTGSISTVQTTQISCFWKIFPLNVHRPLERISICHSCSALAPRTSSVLVQGCSIRGWLQCSADEVMPSRCLREG